MRRPSDNAFPQTAPTQYRDASGEMRQMPTGMTVREYVATNMLSALLSNPAFYAGLYSVTDSVAQKLTQRAVRIADGLIEECNRYVP